MYLLLNAGSSTRAISRALGLHRVDVYRRLHELENYGLIESGFGIPRTYSATPPRAALSGLLQKQEEKLSHLRYVANDLIIRLNNMKRSALNKLDGSTILDSSYRVVVGRSHYYSEIRKLIHDAHSEVLRMSSPRGIERTFSTGLYEECVRATRRGVIVRMLSDVDSHNRLAKRLSHAVHLRFMQGDHPRFIVVDKQFLAMKNSGLDDEPYISDSSENIYFILRNPKVAQAYCYLFNHLWSHASG